MFNGLIWTNTTGKYNFTSIGVRSALEFGVFNFNPTFVYSPGSNFLPEVQAYGRIFVKGKLFKAKKLEALVGIDVSYISSFINRLYLPAMDTYDWSSSVSSFDGMINLHAFLSLGISEFRFFVRYENIGYFWSDKTNNVISRYPVSPTRLRIGLTWDFFN